MSQVFTLGCQSIGASASALVLPMNIKDGFPLGLTGLNFLQSRDSQESFPTPQFKSISSSVLSFLKIVQLSYPYITTGKTIALTRRTFVSKVMSISSSVQFSSVAQSCPTLCDPWTVAQQAPPSMGFSRQEYWSGLPFPSPGGLPDPRIKPKSPTLHADALTSAPPGKPSIKVDS